MTPSRMQLPTSADPARDVPAGAGSRRDRIEAALATLAAEERRVARIGLEWPLARCREQRRYWSFLSALYAMSDDAGRLAAGPREGSR